MSNSSNPLFLLSPTHSLRLHPVLDSPVNCQRACRTVQRPATTARAALPSTRSATPDPAPPSRSSAALGTSGLGLPGGDAPCRACPAAARTRRAPRSATPLGPPRRGPSSLTRLGTRCTQELGPGCLPGSRRGPRRRAGDSASSGDAGKKVGAQGLTEGGAVSQVRRFREPQSRLSQIKSRAGSGRVLGIPSGTELLSHRLRRSALPPTRLPAFPQPPHFLCLGGRCSLFKDAASVSVGALRGSWYDPAG